MITEPQMQGFGINRNVSTSQHWLQQPKHQQTDFETTAPH